MQKEFRRKEVEGNRNCEGGGGRRMGTGMIKGQTNNRDRKAIRENGGKEIKTKKSKGTKK
jgi:hypothetical protein